VKHPKTITIYQATKKGGVRKMAEGVGSELDALISDHLSKVKRALQSRSNMDRTIKEEAIQSVSEIGAMLNSLSGMFEGLESMLEKTLKTAEKDKTRLYSEQLAASHGPKVNQPKRIQTVAHPSDTNNFVPKEIEAADIKSTIIQQNNLHHLNDSVLQKKFTKRSLEDARHVVNEAPA
jgi:hypothetical protein